MTRVSSRIWRELPPEAWISDGRQVLHFRPSRWDRWCQQLELITGERFPGQPHAPQPQEPARQQERYGPDLPDPRGHEVADAG